MTTRASTRAGATGIALTSVSVGLTLTTAYIHSTLGGLLFTLNAIGYAALAASLIVAATVPMPLVQRFRWLPIVALAGYTLTTIGGYLVIGPYFSLGWIAKGVEIALLVTLAVTVRRAYGGVGGLVGEARASIGWLIGRFSRRTEQERAGLSAPSRTRI